MNPRTCVFVLQTSTVYVRLSVCTPTGLGILVLVALRIHSHQLLGQRAQAPIQLIQGSQQHSGTTARQSNELTKLLERVCVCVSDAQRNTWIEPWIFLVSHCHVS